MTKILVPGPDSSENPLAQDPKTTVDAMFVACGTLCCEIARAFMLASSLPVHLSTKRPRRYLADP